MILKLKDFFEEIGFCPDWSLRTLQNGHFRETNAATSGFPAPRHSGWAFCVNRSPGKGAFYVDRSPKNKRGRKKEQRKMKLRKEKTSAAEDKLNDKITFLREPCLNLKISFSEGHPYTSH